MKFGYFDDDRREYVIQTPETPLPWINYLGSRDFFSLVSNTCGGYSFYRDAKLLRLTRYRYNNIPADSNGKYYYIRDGADIWNPGFMPVRTPLDFYECRHGLGYSHFTGRKNDLQADLLAFVPVDSPCEINHLHLTNTGSVPKTVTLFSYVEFCLWNAVDDAGNFQRNLSIGEVEIEEGGSVIYHKSEYRERRNHYAFFSVNAPVDGFDSSRDAFLGQGRGNDAPEAVLSGRCTNSVASGWYPAACQQIGLTLAPGEEKELIFILGYCENPRDQKFIAPNVIRKDGARAIRKKYDDPAKVRAAFAALQAGWEELLSRWEVFCDNEHVSRMVNIWNPYQCMITFNMSRSASYYESGTGRGMGFRDSCQDLLGFVHLIPDRARERILDIAATQFPDGSAYHQYQPLTRKGNADIGSGFNDDPLWLIAAAAAYVKETGDSDILKEMVPFDCVPGSEVSLFEHLRRSFHFTTSHLGPHGLPLIGRADWNDCLNLNCFSAEPGESFQTTGPSEGPVAESVFIAALFVRYGHDYARLAALIGQEEESRAALQAVAEMERAVLNNGWDGDWFLRAYDAHSEKVGSKDCEEGKIYIEPQGFCVYAGIGVKEGLAEKALDSVAKWLDCPYGVMILQPSYTSYHLNLGEISSYPPGYKENGGIFCHNNPWISIAETVIGRGGRAFEVYKKTCPSFIEDLSEIHRTEPYCYSQMIAGRDAPRFGEAKNSWLTGTAAWAFVNISQAILGIRPDFDGLIVDPCIPGDFGSFTVRRTFRQTIYEIEIVQNGSCEKGVTRLLVDGRTIPGNKIPVERGKRWVSVRAELG